MNVARLSNEAFIDSHTMVLTQCKSAVALGMKSTPLGDTVYPLVHEKATNGALFSADRDVSVVSSGTVRISECKIGCTVVEDFN